MNALRAAGSRNSRHISKHPHCVYCGGGVAAVQVDHVPPISIFTLRRRPEGLEFGACAECHQGTRSLDAVAAFYSRLYPNPSNEAEEEELLKLHRGLASAAPMVSLEISLNVTRPVANSYGALMNRVLGGGEQLNVFGRVARSYMDRFAARVALALHYDATGTALPRSGMVFARTLTNTALTRGDLPESVLESMGDFRALVQKGLQAEDDFAYVTNFGRDTSETVTFFRLRKSMGALAFCFTNPPRSEAPGYKGVAPGFLKFSVPMQQAAHITGRADTAP